MLLLLSTVFQQSQGRYKNIAGYEHCVTHHHGGYVYRKQSQPGERICVKCMECGVFGGVLNLVIEILVGLGSAATQQQL